MKANELRIGNYILINGLPVETGYFVIETLVNKEKHGKNHNAKFEPIPLTPEILVKAGYGKNMDTGNYVNHLSTDDSVFTRMVIEKSENGFSFCIVGNNYDSYNVDIQHVHHLQNLYKALVGEELPIEL